MSRPLFQPRDDHVYHLQHEQAVTDGEMCAAEQVMEDRDFSDADDADQRTLFYETGHAQSSDTLAMSAYDLYHTHSNSMPVVYRLPIYTNWFKSTLVYEQDKDRKLAQKIMHLRRKEKKGGPNVPHPPSNVMLPPTLFCQRKLFYNPLKFTRAPFMQIYRRGRTMRVRSNARQPQTLLASRALQQDPALVTNITEGTDSVETYEEDGSAQFANVWETVMPHGTIMFEIEFVNPQDFEQPAVVLISDGARRVTTTSYGSQQMQWTGTTGVGSIFGSRQFCLRIGDEALNPMLNRNVPRDFYRPVAVYTYLESSIFGYSRKSGEFCIWESAIGLADVIVAMGLVLRANEMRKDMTGPTWALGGTFRGMYI